MQAEFVLVDSFVSGSLVRIAKAELVGVVWVESVTTSRWIQRKSNSQVIAGHYNVVEGGLSGSPQTSLPSLLV